MTMRRSSTLAAIAGFALAAILLAAGGLLLWGSAYTHNMVHNQLAAQKIYFPPKPAFAHPVAGGDPPGGLDHRAHLLTAVERDIVDMEAQLRAGWLLTLKATWLLDHNDADGQPAAAVVAALDRTTSATGELTRDEVLDNITLYWLTNTGVSASRLYWEYKGGFFNAKGVSIPVAVTVFPGEQYQAPRSWTERAYAKLIYYNRAEKGGHFAAWEQPELFAQELRAAFKSLRKSASTGGTPLSLHRGR